MQRNYAIYSCIIGVWLAIIAGFLYLPDLIWQTKSERVIRILTWGDIFDLHALQQFEKETGIAVKISYYASNEELLVKLKKTASHRNVHNSYDLVIPSDYAVGILMHQGLLKKLDQARMPFIKRINPLLMNRSFDPENQYCIPLVWELYGIGFDTKQFDQETIKRKGWDLLFNDSAGAYRVVMTNDPTEAIMTAAYYLYGPVETLTSEQQQAVQDLLVAQNSFVEAYSSVRAGYYLATGNSPLAFTTTSAIWNTKKYAPHISFALPEQGGFITIEHCAIPVDAEHEDLIYQFMEFIYRPSVIMQHQKLFSNLPAVVDKQVIDGLDPELRQYALFSVDQFRMLHRFNRLISEDRMNQIWVAVKA